MDELSKTLGQKIRKKRKEKKWSQEQLAYVVSVSQGTISNFESGTRTPDIFLALKFNLAFETDITDCIPKESIKIETV